MEGSELNKMVQQYSSKKLKQVRSVSPKFRFGDIYPDSMGPKFVKVRNFLSSRQKSQGAKIWQPQHVAWSHGVSFKQLDSSLEHILMILNLELK